MPTPAPTAAVTTAPEQASEPGDHEQRSYACALTRRSDLSRSVIGTDPEPRLPPDLWLPLLCAPESGRNG